MVQITEWYKSQHGTRDGSQLSDRDSPCISTHCRLASRLSLIQSIEADEGLGRRRRRRRRRSPEAVSPIPQEQTGAQRLAERETISCTLRPDGAKAVQLAVSLLIPII